MALVAGSRFGPYELVSPLGAGGMGEVYRAHDPRLRRDVALKVLPSSLAADADRLRRFQQEAQATSQLNHPNILTVFDVGQQDGAPYIVSELLDGETLRHRLTRGRLPLRNSIDFALQIARGAAAAHERGIIHRDLKPDNIFIVRDNHVKILDFGLAKLALPADLLHDGSTLTLNTEAGVMLGTVGYLSPEQARGSRVDPRTDIFSFGAILYEMLTGSRAFGGDTAADTLAQVLTASPAPPSEIDREIPPALDRIVLHALEKDPDQRFQAMRDIVFMLEGLTTTSTAATALLPAPGASKRPWLIPAVIFVLIFAALLATRVFRWPTPAPAPQASAPVLLQRLTDFVGMEQAPAVSPDGKSVAFSGGTGTPQIWVRLLAGGAPLQITRDNASHQYPRWSPDSASLIYFSPTSGSEEDSGAIYDVPALGGSPRRLVTSFTGGDISHDGKQIAYFRREAGKPELVIADRNGSTPRVLAALPPDFDYGFPRWSPDDRLVGFQRGRVFSYDIFVVPVAQGEPRQITHGLKFVAGYAWLPDGSGVVCSSSRNTTALYLPSLDLFVAKLDGSPVRQLTLGDASFIDPDVGANGQIFATQLRREINIWKFPIDGSPAGNTRRGIQVTSQTALLQTPSLDPDEHEMVYVAELAGHTNLWVMKLDGSQERRQITFERDPDVAIGTPLWSPDGRNITFFTRRPGTRVGDQWVVHPDGSNLRRVVAEGGQAAWSHDGKWLYFTPQGAEGEPYKIAKIPVDGGDAVVVRTDNSFISPAPSADGKTLYFIRTASRAGGQDMEVLVASPEAAASRLLARIPARRMPTLYVVQPVVSPDDKWLAMMLADGATTNLYLLPTHGGPLRQVTDFGNAATEIARRVSWSSDSKYIYAAVARIDGDVVLLTNLLQRQ